jgi:hypothetical protein
MGQLHSTAVQPYHDHDFLPALQAVEHPRHLAVAVQVALRKANLETTMSLDRCEG